MSEEERRRCLAGRTRHRVVFDSMFIREYGNVRYTFSLKTLSRLIDSCYYNANSYGDWIKLSLELQAVNCEYPLLRTTSNIHITMRKLCIDSSGSVMGTKMQTLTISFIDMTVIQMVWYDLIQEVTWLTPTGHRWTITSCIYQLEEQMHSLPTWNDG